MNDNEWELAPLAGDIALTCIRAKALIYKQIDCGIGYIGYMQENKQLDYLFGYLCVRAANYTIELHYKNLNTKKHKLENSKKKRKKKLPSPTPG